MNKIIFLKQYLTYYNRYLKNEKLAENFGTNEYSTKLIFKTRVNIHELGNPSIPSKGENRKLRISFSLTKDGSQDLCPFYISAPVEILPTDNFLFRPGPKIKNCFAFLFCFGTKVRNFFQNTCRLRTKVGNIFEALVVLGRKSENFLKSLFDLSRKSFSDFFCFSTSVEKYSQFFCGLRLGSKSTFNFFSCFRPQSKGIIFFIHNFDPRRRSKIKSIITIFQQMNQQRGVLLNIAQQFILQMPVVLLSIRLIIN